MTLDGGSEAGESRPLPGADELAVVAEVEREGMGGGVVLEVNSR